MKISKLRLLLSCHGWEDFPTHVNDDDAENLLSAWTALWHPALIAAAKSVPVWHRVDSPPENCSEFLFIAPLVSREQLPTGFDQRVKDQSGCLITESGPRDEIANACLAAAEIESDIAAERIDAFYALGFVYLQIQIMTRQYRYSSSLDDAQFERLVLEATEGIQSNDQQQFDDLIIACFDLLSEERNRYFSNEIYLIDWTIATGELVKRLPKQLELIRQNVLIDGAGLDCLSEDPGLVSQLRKELDDSKICILGGESNELRSNFLSIVTLVNQFTEGQNRLESTLGSKAKVFARKRFGINSTYPQLLNSGGFIGAIHATMDDGRFPTHPDNHVRWAGFSDDAIPALVEPPLDANLAESFLQLSGTISNAIDRRHMAIVVFAHWAGQVGTWYRDLMVAGKYSSTIGRFVLLDNFFENEAETDTSQNFGGDDYHSPFHKQSVIKNELDPISRWTHYWKSIGNLHSAAAVAAMSAPFAKTAGEVDEAFAKIKNTQSEVDRSTEGNSHARLSESANELRSELVVRFAESICTKESDQGGFLIVNPQSVVRRQWFQLDADGVTCDQDKVIYCQDKTAAGVHAVVDVPACGFVFLKRDRQQSPSGRMLSLVEDNVLRNEFFQITPDPDSGGIRSVMIYNERGNLFSQQIAMRQSENRKSRSRELSSYSKMKLDSLKIIEQNLVRAKLQATGHLINDDRTLCEFTQTVTITRGIRVFDIDIELRPKEKVKPNPWVEYFAARLAWNDEAAKLYRSINESHEEVTIGKIESPLYMEIDAAAHKTTVFTDGMPYLRRDGYRKLDCVLATSNESQRQFNLGVGIDVKNPLQTAYQRLAPMQTTQTERQPANASGWVFHFSSRNALPVHWNFDSRAGERGQTEIWIKETEGRELELKISCPREPKQAVTIDLCNQQSGQCEVTEDQVRLKLGRYAFRRLVIDW